MSESPAERIRRRMSELRVGHISDFPVGPVRDHLPDAIGARDLEGGQVEIRDHSGNSWTGDAGVALEALAELSPTATGDPGAVWEQLAMAR